MTTAGERWVRLLFHDWRIYWKVAFALVAMADFLGCWPIFLEGWRSAVSQNKPGVSSSTSGSLSVEFLAKQQSGLDDETCSTYSIAFYNILGKCLYTIDLMGPLFCLMCIVEAVRRAQEAREDMLEMAALDNFEKKLARLYSSARVLQPAQEEETMYDEDDILARKHLRYFIPVFATLAVWGVLLPWRSMLETRCGSEADTALATLWINQSLTQLGKVADYAKGELVDRAWQILLPFSFWQPHKIYKRILTLLRWVRYFRFAGPLLRMLLKLNDQFLVFLKTSKQAWQANAEKAKRIIHRSMLFQDIQKLESETKRSTLARVPTRQVVQMANEQSTEVGNIIKEKQQQEKKLKKELASLKLQASRSSTIFPTSELYDRIVDLSQELTTTVGSTLWTANLISPRTRFSISWRIIVTCALVSELCRICTSFQLYGRVDVSYTTMMMSVLGCANDRGGNILTATGRLTRKIVRKIIRLPKQQLLSVCTKSSIATHTLAQLCLSLSWCFETSIDLICFLDIYVWFFTGELDPEGRVIPKPFVYRCIIPGTLVQVIDHPTVPDVLPNIFYYSVTAANAVGYSRLIRWVVAIVPSINAFLVDPIKKFLFRPMEQDEWLRYTESLAIFPAISGADIRYTVSCSHPNLSNIDAAYNQNQSNIRRTTSINIMDIPTRIIPPSPSREYNMGRTTSRKSISFMPEIAGSFLPSVMELRRRESSSAGLNLDATSQHVHDDSGEETTMRRRTGSTRDSRYFQQTIDRPPALED